MTSDQKRRQNYRDHGKYAKVNPCYVCNSSAGLDYYSHPDTDVTIGDELLCLCESCNDKLCELPGPEAVKKAFPSKP